MDNGSDGDDVGNQLDDEDVLKLKETDAILKEFKLDLDLTK
jgi:hypothetical protein